MTPRRHRGTEIWSRFPLRVSVPPWLILPLIIVVVGCANHKSATPQERSAAARELFDHTTKLYHLPSATAQGMERERLLEQAAAGYRQLLQRYPDQPFWCARALRSLGNVRAEEGKLDEAFKLYDRVAKKYSQEDWKYF